jgi:putative phosphoribosyl transferase
MNKRRGATDMPVEIPVASGVRLQGRLSKPDDVHGVVLFVLPTSSDRLTTRDNFIASELQRVGIGTLLFGLLTREEVATDGRYLDVELLKGRLRDATQWATQAAAPAPLMVGYFGDGTGVAAALRSAVAEPTVVRAIVSLSGRIDLTEAELSKVRAPLRLIVSEADALICDVNRDAYEQLTAVKSLDVVPGAMQLFDEPGAIGRVAELTKEWFLRYLSLDPSMELDGINPNFRPDTDYRPRRP